MAMEFYKRGWDQTSSYIATKNADVEYGTPLIAPGAAFNVQAYFPMAEYCTAQFSMHSDPDTSCCIRGLATVRWTVAGTPQQRKFHVGHGTSISAPAQAIWVGYEDASYSEHTGEDGSLENIHVVAQVSIGPGAGALHPPMFCPPPIELAGPGGDSFTYDVPQDCGINQVYIFRHSTGTEDGTPDLLVTSNARLIYWGDSMFNKWVPLIPGVNKIKLEYVGVGGPIRASVIFGIDG